jgi:hypothetical protein
MSVTRSSAPLHLLQNTGPRRSAKALYDLGVTNAYDSATPNQLSRSPMRVVGKERA